MEIFHHDEPTRDCNEDTQYVRQRKGVQQPYDVEWSQHATLKRRRDHETNQADNQHAHHRGHLIDKQAAESVVDGSQETVHNVKQELLLFFGWVRDGVTAARHLFSYRLPKTIDVGAKPGYIGPVDPF